MPYLGNEPGAITDAFTQTFTGDGSETNFTLSQSSTTNAVFVRISGVMQRNGTDFTVSGTTLSFTTAPPAASNNIVVQFFTVGSIQTIADDAVATAKIADNAVTLAKLAGGTDGNLITFDASGDPAFVATGSSGQLLTSAGAGSPPTFTTVTGGGLILIGTQVASDDANLTQTGLDASTYDSFLVTFNGMHPQTDDVTPQIQFGDSSGIDDGGSDYSFATSQFGSGNATSFTRQGSVSSGTIDLEGQDASTDRIGNSTGEGWSAMATLQVGSTAMYPNIHGNGHYYTAQPHPRLVLFSGMRLAQIVVDRILFKFSSGNIVSGRMTVHGIRHA